MGRLTHQKFISTDGVVDEKERLFLIYKQILTIMFENHSNCYADDGRSVYIEGDVIPTVDIEGFLTLIGKLLKDEIIRIKL